MNSEFENLEQEVHAAHFDLQAGQIVFEKFEVVKPLGSGGMGEVYEVRNVLLNTKFALKVLPKGDRDAKALIRFQNEAKTVSRLSHPNIAAVYDFGVGSDGRAFMAIELCQGRSLKEVLFKDW